MEKRLALKRTLTTIIGIIIIAVCVLLLIQGFYYRNLEISMQQETIGYYKEDVHLLTYGQQVAQTCCWVIGAVCGMIGVGTIGFGWDVLSI